MSVGVPSSGRSLHRAKGPCDCPTLGKALWTKLARLSRGERHFVSILPDETDLGDQDGPGQGRKGMEGGEQGNEVVAISEPGYPEHGLWGLGGSSGQ